MHNTDLVSSCRNQTTFPVLITRAADRSHGGDKGQITQ